MRIIKTIVKTHQTYLDHQGHPGIYCLCPDCGGEIVYGLVTCRECSDPSKTCYDKNIVCLVGSWNYGCTQCKSVFDITFEHDKYDDVQPPEQKHLIVQEEIGPAIVNPRGIIAQGSKHIIGK
jgi:hypothetical protein